MPTGEAKTLLEKLLAARIARSPDVQQNKLDELQKDLLDLVRGDPPANGSEPLLLHRVSAAAKALMTIRPSTDGEDMKSLTAAELGRVTYLTAKANEAAKTLKRMCVEESLRRDPEESGCPSLAKPEIAKPTPLPPEGAPDLCGSIVGIARVPHGPKYSFEIRSVSLIRDFSFEAGEELARLVLARLGMDFVAMRAAFLNATFPLHVMRSVDKRTLLAGECSPDDCDHEKTADEVFGQFPGTAEVIS